MMMKETEVDRYEYKNRSFNQKAENNDMLSYYPQFYVAQDPSLEVSGL